MNVQENKFYFILSLLSLSSLKAAEQNQPKSNVKLYALGAASLGAVGYLGYTYLASGKKQKPEKQDPDLEAYGMLKAKLARRGSFEALDINPNYRVFESSLDEIFIKIPVSSSISFEEFKERKLQKLAREIGHPENDRAISLLAKASVLPRT